MVADDSLELLVGVPFVLFVGSAIAAQLFGVVPRLAVGGLGALFAVVLAAVAVYERI